MMRNFFAELEAGLLADGRDWILGTTGPSMADIEVVWVPAWMMGMKGALEEGILGEGVFPKVWAYVRRFLGVFGEARKRMGRMERVKGEVAARQILGAAAAQGGVDGVGKDGVEEGDPLGLKVGQVVSVWPTDSGSSHRDQGRLVRLSWDEIVVEKDVEGEAGKGSVRLHFPRTGFRVVSVEGGKTKL